MSPPRFADAPITAARRCSGAPRQTLANPAPAQVSA